MPLTDETLGEIDTQVRSGFESRDRVIEIFCEEMYAPGDLDPTEVSTAVDAAIQAHELAKAAWPEITDCDRLNRAFERLAFEGIICLHNAGYTQSDGFDDFRESYRSHPERGRIRGYCFYHGQDTERAVEGGGLFLAFGPADPKQEEIEGPVVGRLITTALGAEGLHSEWDGTFAKRIFIPQFIWQKR
jgi:hypothetical protein